MEQQYGPVDNTVGYGGLVALADLCLFLPVQSPLYRHTTAGYLKKMTSPLRKYRYSPEEVSPLTRRTMTSSTKKLPTYVKNYGYSPEELTPLTRGTMTSSTKKLPTYMKNHGYCHEEVSPLTRRTMTSSVKKLSTYMKKIVSALQNRLFRDVNSRIIATQAVLSPEKAFSML
jgi:hypothetical protein